MFSLCGLACPLSARAGPAELRVCGYTYLCLAVDNVVICAGQVSDRSLEAPLEEAGVTVHVIGGASQASELDARRAFDQGTRLAATV